jgi:hypothetical protein
MMGRRKANYKIRTYGEKKMKKKMKIMISILKEDL